MGPVGRSKSGLQMTKRHSGRGGRSVSKSPRPSARAVPPRMHVTLYMAVTIGSSAIITLWGYSFTDSLFMVASCIGCNGLGYGVTGAGGGYWLLPHAVKWLLIVDMLVGRIELFTFLVLLLPSFWRR